jgi:heme-degrading monooxygenase HmoA
VIVRVLTARVPPRNVGRFNELLRAQLAELKEQEGLVYVKLARRLDQSDGEEVVLFEEWRAPADLWQWTGGQLSKPRLLPGTEELIAELSIQHYEALDVDPSDPALMAIRSRTADKERVVLEAVREPRAHSPADEPAQPAAD